MKQPWGIRAGHPGCLHGMLGFEGMVTPLGKKNLRSILPEHLVIPGFFMYTNVEPKGS